MAASGGQSKISPRKFSEKIALLNKKEAEGNAEFEEIIKEVQATRNQSACGVANNGNLASGAGLQDLGRRHRDELEEVFENLIKCVGQYEQELQEESEASATNEQPRLQQLLQLNEANSGNTRAELIGNFDESAARSASAELVNMYQKCSQTAAQVGIPTNSLPLNNNIIIDDNSNSDQLGAQTFTSPTIGNQDHDLNFAHIQYASAVTTTTTPATTRSANLSGSTNSFYAQEAASADPQITTCRARVTSFGSGSCRYTSNGISANYNNQAYCQDGRATVCGDNSMFLKPACDRSWQKSCSDPTLHVPCVPISAANSCSENLLLGTMTPAGGEQVTNSAIGTTSNNNYSAIMIVANSAAQAVAANNGQHQGQQQQQQQLETVRSSASLSNYIDNLARATMLAQSDHDNDEPNYMVEAEICQLSSGVVGVLDTKKQQQQLMTQCQYQINSPSNDQRMLAEEQLYGVSDNSNTSASMSIISDVPGIQICTFDDDVNNGDSNSANQQQQLQVVMEHSSIGSECQTSASMTSTRPESCDSSLPDIANLQFNVPTDNNTSQAQQQQAYNQRQNGFQHQHEQQQHVDVNMNANEPVNFQDDGFSQRQTVPAGNQSMPVSNSNSILTMTNSTDWTCSAPNNVPICALRVNNFLSNSDCGLQWTSAAGSNEASLTADETGSGSMLRSHSHNSIDYLTKQRQQHQLQLQDQQQQQDQHQHQLPQQQQHHHHQYQMPTQQLVMGANPQAYVKQNSHYLHLYQQQQQQQQHRSGAKCVSHFGGGQRGSMSPSSNLSSPQSDQNSSGASSSTDYGEYVSFGSTALPTQVYDPNSQVQQQRGNGCALVANNPPASVYLMRQSGHEVQGFASGGAHPAQGSQQQQQQPKSSAPRCYASTLTTNTTTSINSNPYYQHQVQQPQHQVHQLQQHQRPQVQMHEAQFVMPNAPELGGSIGPCPSPSAARRLHNQAARGPAYSPFQLSRGLNNNNNNNGGGLNSKGA